MEIVVRPDQGQVQNLWFEPGTVHRKPAYCTWFK
ncbi:MAG: hypothetical protein ACI9SE_002256, partial [Neolewinella sp.]